MKKLLIALPIFGIIFLHFVFADDEVENSVSVHHEWGTLKEVILGRGEDLLIYSWSDQLEQLKPDPELVKLFKENAGKPYADVYPEKSKKIVEQMNNLAKILEERGIIVRRNRLFSEDEKNYLWDVQKGGSLLFMRDPVLVIDNNIIETALQGPPRRKERYSIRPILLSAAKRGNVRYVSMPVASPRMQKENETDPFIEGGDVLLNGYEIYVGNSGRASNKAGIDWLQEYLGPKYTVHEIKLDPECLHLDCAMALLKPGLGIICREWIKSDLPDSLKDFDFVEATEDEAKRLGTNVFVLDEKTVIVDEQHKRIADELRKKGQEVVAVPYDAVSAWGGAFRCSYHPLRRESKLE